MIFCLYPHILVTIDLSEIQYNIISQSKQLPLFRPDIGILRNIIYIHIYYIILYLEVYFTDDV